MRVFDVIALRLRSLFRARKVDEDLNDEIRLHFEQQIEENLARGMTRDEARHDALRTIGSITQIKEECRDMRRVNWIGAIGGDLRYALRVLGKNPGFFSVAVLTLALGVGVNTAIFSVINAVLLSPLPYRDPDSLVMVKEVFPQIGPAPISVSGPDIAQIQKLNHVFEAVGGFRLWTYELSGTTDPERVTANRASSDLFKVLGVEPFIGRAFTVQEEPPGHHVVLLSYQLWQSRFGGDRGILGHTVSLDRKPYTIIGVMPKSFVFPLPGMQQGPAADLWVPLALTKEELSGVGDSFDYSVLAKVKSEVQRPQADADLQIVGTGILDTYKQWARDNNASLGDIRLGLIAEPLTEDVRGPVKMMLLVLFGAVGFVLLVACVNVANLLLSRATTRQKEMAVRLAMGTGRFRLVRQLVVEGMVLTSLGGALGLAAAIWIKQILVETMPANIPLFRAVEVDSRVLAFAFLLATVTGLVFGVLPAASASRTDLNQTLKEGGRAPSEGHAQLRMRAALVVVDPGFRPEHVVTASIDLPPTEYREDAKVVAFFKQLMDSISKSPGVIAAGGSPDLPLQGAWTHLFSPEGYQSSPGASGNPSNHSIIFGNYLQAIGVPLLRGRYFTAQDQPKSPHVLIVSESLARKYWPGQDPIGKRLKWGTPSTPDEWMIVVGVVGDVKQGPLDTATVPHTYEAYTQFGALISLRVAVRGQGEPENLVPILRAAVSNLDRQLPVARIRTMEEVINRSTSVRRFNVFLLASFALLALILTAIGIYGVLAYSVTRRTHEIGVRMALGARGHDVIRLVLRQALRLTTIGVIIGVGGALSLTRFLQGFLFEVRPTDPPTFAGVLSILGFVALAASYFPARRAARIEPALALRDE